MIEFTLTRGLRRSAACGLVGALVLAGGWFWFGLSGLGLAALWCASAWPRWRERNERWSLAEVSAVWLWAGTLAVQFYGGRTCWVFEGELPECEYAALRRALKAQIEGLL